VGVDEVERGVGERELLAVGDLELRAQALLLEIGPGERDGRRGQVDAGHAGAAPRKAREVDPRAAAHLENHPAPVAVKLHEPQQVMELFEVILVEIVEEAPGPDRMPRDRQVVDVMIPVAAHLRCRHHAGDTIAGRMID